MPDKMIKRLIIEINERKFGVLISLYCTKNENFEPYRIIYIPKSELFFQIYAPKHVGK